MLKSKKKLPLSVVVLPFLFSSCTVGPDYERPQADVPSTWQSVKVSEGKAAISLEHERWWDRFKDPQLTALIQEAVSKNKILLRSAYQVKQVEALLGVARADFYPQIDAQGRINRKKFSENHQPQSVQNPYHWDYEGSINLSYEIDFWGRVRRREESAMAALMAQKAAQQTVLLTVVTAVAQRYLTLRAMDGALALARERLNVTKSKEALVQQRFKQGFSSALEVEEAVTQKAKAQQDVAGFEQQAAVEEHALCALLGKNPSSISRGKPLERIHLPPVQTGVLPSQLLTQRPDVIQAEHDLIAKNADVGVARAEFFPRIDLLAFIGVESQGSHSFYSTKTILGGIGPGFVAPLFQGGRIQQKVKAAEAQHQEALVAYLETLQVAFQETEDALVGSNKSLQTHQQQQQVQTAQNTTYQLQNSRFQQGMDSRLALLSAREQLLKTKEHTLNLRLKAFLEQLKLYKALGGGWTNELLHQHDPHPKGQT